MLILRRFRRNFVLSVAAISLGGAWGSLAAIGAKGLFELAENDAWLLVGLPAGALIVVLSWKKLPLVLGFDSNVAGHGEKKIEKIELKGPGSN